MKFSLFVHMGRVTSDVSHRQLYEEYIELCKCADQGGFATIWTGEHHGMDFTIAPNPFTALVDLAHHTEHVRLGIGVLVAPFWHPIRVAGEGAMTDVMTNGRLEIGFARGAYTFEYDRLFPGLDAWEAGQKLRTMIPLVKELWAGDCEHHSKHWSFPKTSSAPKPLQQPHPPLWIAARDPNTIEFAVANGCNVHVTPLWLGDDEVDTLMARVNAACAAHPHIPRPQVMLLRNTYVAESEAELVAASNGLSHFYCHFGAWFKNERPISQALIQPLSDDEMAELEMYSPANMRANSVVGTPEEVISRIKAYEALGYDEYSFWIDSSLPYAEKRKSLELFIDKVMPAFA